MKILHVYCTIMLFLMSCNQEKPTGNIIDLSEIPIQQVEFETLPLDTSKIIYPMGIMVLGEHLVLATPKEEKLFSFWNRKTIEYEFSSTIKGQGPDDIGFLDVLYLYSSDSCIRVLDNNTEVEMKLEGNQLKTIKRTPIIIGDAVNGLMRIADNHYIMDGATYKADFEHYRYDGENVTKFGQFPEPNESIKDYEVVLFNQKQSIHKQEKDIFFNFYYYLNLVRQYDINGKLLKEIHLKGMPQKENTYQAYMNKTDKPCTPYWDRTRATNKNIYVMFYQGQTCNELWKKDRISPPKTEIQVWDWDGNLKGRYSFDKSFSNFTVSEDGIMYAYDLYKGDAIYRYKF